MRQLCGKPTRQGSPCKLPRPCPTHNHKLAARNAKVRASFASRDPQAYAAHQSEAGRRGYQAAGAKVGWEKMIEKARQWRLAHPSGPERWAIGLLEQAGLNHYEREYPLSDGYSLDIAWPEHKRAIEIDGHPSRASESEQLRRQARQEHKLAELAAEGWQVLVIDATTDRAAGAAAIVEFVRAAQPQDLFERIPHGQSPVSESNQTPF